MQVPEILDRAKSHTGSDGATARQLGVTPQRVNDWRSGRRPMPLEVQVRTCVLGGIVDGDLAAHVREVAGVPAGKRRRRQVHGVLRSLGSLAIGAAVLVGLPIGPDRAIDATMYRRSNRDRRRETAEVEQERRQGFDRRLQPA